MIFCIRRLFFLFVAAVLMTAASGRPQRLEFAEQPRLVDCDPASSSPCFRMRLNVVDSQGSPVALELPNADALARQITIRCDGQEIAPFYASGASEAPKERKRVALLLLDNSGSMNARLPDGRTRFEAARAAAEAFVRGIEAGRDQVAVAPFGSHDVLRLIQSARFVSNSEDALREISNLGKPKSQNNTALFSAVTSGVDRLTEIARTNRGADAILLVMTDGRNDVRPGDDAGLLSGQPGIDAAAAKVRAAGFPVVTVGFGNPESLDAEAMKQISTRSQIVQDAGALQRVFMATRVLLQDRLHVTFTAPWRDRASLAGRAIPLQVSLTLPDGSAIQSARTTWSSPQISAPVYEDRCDAAEMKAALRMADGSGASYAYLVLRPALVFLGLGSVLLVLWFWVPRLIWPDEYIGRQLQMISSRKRWPSSDHSAVHPSTRRAPPGFGTAHTMAPRPRGPADATVADPASRTGTRTRLELDLPERGS